MDRKREREERCTRAEKKKKDRERDRTEEERKRREQRRAWGGPRQIKGWRLRPLAREIIRGHFYQFSSRALLYVLLRAGFATSNGWRPVNLARLEPVDSRTATTSPDINRGKNSGEISDIGNNGDGEAVGATRDLSETGTSYVGT